VIYELLRPPLLALLRAPDGPPEAPAGSPGSTEVFRASPRFLTYRLLLPGLAAAVLVALGVIVLALRASGSLDARPSALLLVALAAVLALSGTWLAIRVDYDLRYYVVTDRSVRVREGAWAIEERTLTFANVQNLRVTQGPLQRLFGIADLRVDAAGGGGASKGGEASEGHGVVVAGVENAHAIRDRIRAHQRGGAGGAGLGDPGGPGRPWRESWRPPGPSARRPSRAAEPSTPSDPEALDIPGAPRDPGRQVLLRYPGGRYGMRMAPAQASLPSSSPCASSPRSSVPSRSLPRPSRPRPT
jgi:membrane protein YdbS with pleckstrin-like domain